MLPAASAAPIAPNVLSVMRHGLFPQKSTRTRTGSGVSGSLALPEPFGDPLEQVLLSAVTPSPSLPWQLHPSLTAAPKSGNRFHGGSAHCPPPNTFNLTNAPASSANTKPVTSIRTIVSPAVFFASLNASRRLRSSLMSRAASGPSSPTSDNACRAPRSAARSRIASNSSYGSVTILRRSTWVSSIVSFSRKQKPAERRVSSVISVQGTQTSISSIGRFGAKASTSPSRTNTRCPIAA